MMKTGRLKLYNTVSDELSKEIRTPCVVFASHPSLRDGSILHFLNMWGNDPKSAIIMTGERKFRIWACDALLTPL